MALIPKKKKKPSKKQLKQQAAEAAERVKGSENRRTLQLDIHKIKEEIEATREKRAAEAAVPEAHIAPEDLVLFKGRVDGEPKAAPTTEPTTPAAELPVAEDEEIELPSLSEIKAGAPAAKTVKMLEAEMAEAESKLERLDTGLAEKKAPEIKETKPLAADAGTFEPVPEASDPDIVKPVSAEVEHVEPGELVPVGPRVTRWQKILGAGKRKKIMIGFGALIAAIVIGAALWYTRSWREWTGNLIVFSIPVLVVLTYVLEYFSQDRFWEDYKHIKFLRKENRADAVVLIPLVMFMGLVGLYSYMSFGQAFLHYIRFIAIATGVWMGLIWLTRRVPPYRKKDE